MLRLTRRTEYGLMALAYLARRGGPGYCSAREIVAALGLPRRLVAETLKDLARARLVGAVRGPHGGYRLARPAPQIALAEVVETLEGSRLAAECTAGGSCELEPGCIIRGGMHELAQRLQQVLRGISVADLAAARPSQPARLLEVQVQGR